MTRGLSIDWFRVNCFFHVASKHSGQSLEVSADHSHVIARHSLDLKLSCQPFPHRGRVTRVIVVGFGAHESYLALIKPGTIARQSDQITCLDAQKGLGK